MPEFALRAHESLVTIDRDRMALPVMALSVTLCPVEVIPENGGRQFRVDGREVAVFRVNGKLYARQDIAQLIHRLRSRHRPV